MHFGTIAKTLLGLLIATFLASACRSAATPEDGDVTVPTVDIVVISTLTPIDITDVETPDPVPARDAALAYLSDQYGGQFLPAASPGRRNVDNLKGLQPSNLSIHRWGLGDRGDLSNCHTSNGGVWCGSDQ